jgi:DNA-binding beta-propeller fold protein YncE
MAAVVLLWRSKDRKEMMMNAIFKQAIWLAMLLILTGGALAGTATRVYWTGSGAITSAKVDGSDIQTVVSGLPGLVGLYDVAVDSDRGKLYFAHKAAYIIERVNLDGTGRDTVISDAYPVGLALDVSGEKIYWTDYTNANPRIRRADFDGSGVEDLFNASSGCDLTGIVLDLAAGHLYWAERMDQQIWRGNLDGTGATLILQCWSGIGHPWDLALAGGRLYWTVGGSHGNAIVSASTDGSDVQTLVSDLPQAPRSLAFDTATQRLYWMNYSTSWDGTVQHIDLDGSGLETLVTTGIRYGYGLALEFDPVSAASDSPQPMVRLSNHPNPFNPSTLISFDLARDQAVQLHVFALDGALLRTLVDEPRAAGHHTVNWDGRDAQGRALPSGVYLYRLTSEQAQHSRRMTMIR